MDNVTPRHPIIVQMAGGIIGGVIVLFGIATMWGSLLTKVDRALVDISEIRAGMYTAREARLEQQVLKQIIERNAMAIEKLAQQMEQHERRIQTLEQNRVH